MKARLAKSGAKMAFQDLGPCSGNVVLLVRYHSSQKFQANEVHIRTVLVASLLVRKFLALPELTRHTPPLSIETCYNDLSVAIEKHFSQSFQRKEKLFGTLCARSSFLSGTRRIVENSRNITKIKRWFHHKLNFCQI